MTFKTQQEKDEAVRVANEVLVETQDAEVKEE